MDHKLCKDCKGFCCDDIGLSISPDDLQISYHKWADDEPVAKGIELKMSSNSIVKGIGKLIGIHLVYPMLVFTHKDNIHPDGDTITEKDNVVYHYYCKHHNKETGDCDIYEERPMICRTFPDNKFCGYRKVKDKRVKGYRPDWFKLGMTQKEWSDGFHGKLNQEENEKPQLPGSEKKADEQPVEDIDK
jgi:Fe-S-cluster containining protein